MSLRELVRRILLKTLLAASNLSCLAKALVSSRMRGNSDWGRFGWQRARMDDLMLSNIIVSCDQ